jgi:hypothetical protein
LDHAHRQSREQINHVIPPELLRDVDVRPSSGFSARQIRAWNASFLTVSLARAQQLLAFEGDVQDFVFSMEDSKRRAYNELFAGRIIRLLPVGLSFDKCLALVENVLNLGVKAA